MPNDEEVRPSRQVQKFSSFAEQEEADFRYWMSRTPAQRLAAAAQISLEKYLSSPKPFAHLPPIYDSNSVEVPPSRVVRKFASFEEQDAWNEANAWPERFSS